MTISRVSRFLIYLALFLALLIAVGQLAPRVLPAPVLGYVDEVAKALGRTYFKLGDLPITPVFLIKALFLLIVLSIASRVTRNLLLGKILDRTNVDIGQKYAIAQIGGYIVFLFGLLIGLQWAGVNLSSLVILGGAVGIGVGFGLQNIANNFISGIILLTERPVRVGDRVEVGGINGDVVRIAARSTWVRTNDNVVIIIPNSEFVNNRVTNWTANDRQVRFPIPLGVSYGSDPDEVREVVLDVARRHPDVLSDPPPEIIFTGFGSSSLDFELRVWTTTRVQFPRILASEIYFLIFRAFKENGIEIPFPQRDLHIRSVSIPIPVKEIQAAPPAPPLPSEPETN